MALASRFALAWVPLLVGLAEGSVSSTVFAAGNTTRDDDVPMASKRRADGAEWWSNLAHNTTLDDEPNSTAPLAASDTDDANATAVHAASDTDADVANASAASDAWALTQGGGGSGGGGARWYAEICRAINCGGGAPGVRGARWFYTGASAALVGRIGGKCLVAFRGTANWGGVLQDIMSLRLVPLPGCPGCMVGDGILAGYNSLAGRIKGALRAQGCSQVSVTGHSLGAAEAVVAVYDLSRSGFHITTSYTFGQPRVGNAAFHHAFAAALRGASFYRVVHGFDPIVQVGPLGSTTHEGTRIYEAGVNVFTDHLHYAGVYMTPCIESVAIGGISDILR